VQDDGFERALVAFFVGCLIGPVIGGLWGYSYFSWSGAVIGAYAGLVLGPCLLGGAIGCMSDSADSVRADASIILAFGIFSSAGALAGYYLGAAFLTPAAGFFLGLAIPGYLAGRVVGRLTHGDTDVLLLFFLAVAGAGGGAALATSKSPGAGTLTAGLLLGSLVGVIAATLTHAAIEDLQDLRYRR
jgi:hypothetical protein